MLMPFTGACPLFTGAELTAVIVEASSVVEGPAQPAIIAQTAMP
jgi:hypothetical protein